MPEPILEMRGVNKSFGPVHVLRDIDLAVYAGEVTARFWRRLEVAGGVHRQSLRVVNIRVSIISTDR